MNADCAAFERWLDEGRTTDGSGAAHAHARGCARCASLLELEDALSGPLRAVAPAEFTDAVILRLHAPSAHARRLVPSVFPVPVWLQALVDPIIALTLTTTVLTWFGRAALLGIGETLARRWSAAHWPAFAWPAFAWPALQLPGAAAVGGLSRALGALSSDPALLTGVLLALVPAVLLGSWQLFRWTDRLVAGVPGRGTSTRAGAHAVAR